jgi:hypothetical protein
MGVGAVFGMPDVFERRNALAVRLGLGGAVFGLLAGLLAVRCRRRWQGALVGALTGAVVGFNSMFWDLGQPDTLGNGLGSAAFYAVLGLLLGLWTVRRSPSPSYA